VMGIDLSKAFDCVDREILLSIIKGKVSENTYRIIKFLISDTLITARVKG
jgi:hypothetical protein